MKLTNRISFRFNLVTSAILVCLLTLFAFNDYRTSEVNLSRQMDNQVNAALFRLEQSLPPTIWNFNASQTLLIADAEVAADVIEAVFVYEDNMDLIAGLKTDVDEELGTTSAEPDEFASDPDHVLVLESSGSELGYAHIYVNDDSIRQALSDTLTQSIIQNLLLIAILIGAIVVLVKVLVSRPIKALSVALADIAQGDGDLTRQIRVRRDDEIGELASNFNIFIEKIRHLVVEVVSSVGSIGEAIHDTRTITARTNEGSRNQRQETDQVAAAMQEMTTTSEEVARSAEAASESAQDADQQGERAREIVHDAIAAIVSLADDIEENAKVVNSLESDVESITTVLDVIRGIAEQTNLLALNAAIEAARAGEQGRGFAVVADEVRTLASRTQASTEEIHTMIEQLEQGAGKAVAAMTESREKGVTTVERAREAESALDSVADAVTRINDKNTQIASAASQQTSVANEISSSLTRIVEVAERAESDSEEAQNTSENLGRLAEELRTLVGSFKV